MGIKSVLTAAAVTLVAGGLAACGSDNSRTAGAQSPSGASGAESSVAQATGSSATSTAAESGAALLACEDWGVYDQDGSVGWLRFHSDGTFDWTNGGYRYVVNGAESNSTWKVSGGELTLSYTNGYTVRSGVLTGDQVLDGKGVGKSAGNFTWTGKCDTEEYNKYKQCVEDGTC